MSTNGEYTIKLFKKLKEEWGEKYYVYCAHSNSKRSNACQPRLYFADYSRATILSYPDIVMVEKENDKVRIICEIEEGTTSPKKTIGDIVNIILSEKLHIKDGDHVHEYEYGSPQLFLGIIVKKEEKSKPKVNELNERLKSAINEQYLNRMGKIKIICDSDKDTLIENIESEIRSILELKQRNQHI